jgi:hypothetical protein
MNLRARCKLRQEESTMQKISLAKASFVMISVVAGLSGCSDGAPGGAPQPTASGSSATDADRPYTETVVHFNDDGTETVHVNHITAAEAQAIAQRVKGTSTVREQSGEVVGSSAQADTAQASCNGQEGVDLFSATCGNTGSVICFSGKSSAQPGANLSNYCESWCGPICCTNWGNAVAAYKGLAEAGEVWGANSTGACTSNSGCAVGFNADNVCHNTDWNTYGITKHLQLTN